jgi:hypothetical protein
LANATSRLSPKTRIRTRETAAWRVKGGTEKEERRAKNGSKNDQRTT